MRAMILAAGKGTRLRPLTHTVPKPLVDVAGRPIIAYVLDLVRAAGITEVVINLHHLGSAIRTALGDGRAHGVRIAYSEEDPILDTGGAIAAARPLLEDDTFVVLNGDTVADLDLRAVIGFHRARGATATMVLRPDPAAARYGLVEIDAEQRVRRILGEPAGVTVPLRPFMFAGIHVFEPRAFRFFPPGVYSSTRRSYPEMLRAGELVAAYLHEGYWRVMDTPADVEAGRTELRNYFRPFQK